VRRCADALAQRASLKSFSLLRRAGRLREDARRTVLAALVVEGQLCTDWWLVALLA
jgi:hypothetical protein